MQILVCHFADNSWCRSYLIRFEGDELADAVIGSDGEGVFRFGDRTFHNDRILSVCDIPNHRGRGRIGYDKARNLFACRQTPEKRRVAILPKLPRGLQADIIEVSRRAVLRAIGYGEVDVFVLRSRPSPDGCYAPSGHIRFVGAARTGDGGRNDVCPVRRAQFDPCPRRRLGDKTQGY